MKITCKRGGNGPRDKSGHCQCEKCKEYASERRRKNPRTEYQRLWRKENPEKSKEYSYRWNENNKQARRLIESRWKRKNPEKVKEYNKKSGKKWSKNNPARRLAIRARRRAALILRNVAWADQEKINKFYITAKMLTESTGVKHEVDHIFPLQGKTVSGLHVHNNLQILPMSENRRKGNKMTLCAA